MLRIGQPVLPLVEIEQAARFQFVAHQPFRDFAVAGFRQRLPEEEAFRHLVARHLWREEARHLGFGHGSGALARHADGDADFAPDRIGHAEHRDLADAGMGQDLLLDLARIDVGAAGDVHVGGAAGDVDKAFRVHVAEIAGAEPAVAKRFRVGVGVVVVAGEHAPGRSRRSRRSRTASIRFRRRPGSRPACPCAQSRRCRSAPAGRPRDRANRAAAP